MFPARLLRFTCSVGVDLIDPRRAVVTPTFLGSADHPWLRVLLDEVRRFAGRPRRELRHRLREPLPCWSPGGKRTLAIHILDRLCRGRDSAPLDPRVVRRALFGAGALYPDDPARALAAAAVEIGATADDLQASLFADLPGEKTLSLPPHDLCVGELALHTNLEVARTLLARSSAVAIELFGNARAVVRHARLRGLICTVRPAPVADACVLEVSGPYALFRRTLVYSRVLGELLPMLAWCNRYTLTAECDLGDLTGATGNGTAAILAGATGASGGTRCGPGASGGTRCGPGASGGTRSGPGGGTATLTLQSGDPITPGPEPRPFDSKLERRFARDFGKWAPDWDLIREPEPVEAGGQLIFPDFALWRRDRPDRRWLLEIVGFWTPDYLRHKLAALRAARLTNLIVCIDAQRNCTDDDLPPDTPVIRYRTSIDPVEVLAIVDPPSTAGHASP